MTLLIHHGRLRESIARLYPGEMILALHSLHKKGIIHNDFKPDNVLISSSGHITLSDFGMSNTGSKIEELILIQPENLFIKERLLAHWAMLLRSY